MTRKARRLIWVLFIVLLLTFTVIEKAARSNYHLSGRTRQIYILPSLKLAPMLSLGFHNAWADLVLLESQIFVHDHLAAGRLEDGKKLKEMIRLVMALDPHYVKGVIFGAFSLSDYWGLMGVADANDLLREAFRNNPDDHRLPMNIGYNYYLNSNNANKAISWFSVALDDPDAPRTLIWSIDTLVSNQKKGVEMHTQAICSMCVQAQEREQKRNLCTRCKFYQIMVELRKLQKDFENKRGKKLNDVGRLIEAGYLRHMPGDPLGGRWIIDDDGWVNSSANPDRPTKISN